MKLMNESFVKRIHLVTRHLRRQQNLICDGITGIWDTVDKRSVNAWASDGDGVVGWLVLGVEACGAGAVRRVPMRYGS